MGERVKGAVFREFVLWYERKFGSQLLIDAFEELPSDLQEHLDFDKPAAGILAGTWYPAELVNTWLEIGERDGGANGVREPRLGALRGHRSVTRGQTMKRRRALACGKPRARCPRGSSPVPVLFHW